MDEYKMLWISTGSNFVRNQTDRTDWPDNEWKAQKTIHFVNFSMIAEWLTRRVCMVGTTTLRRHSGKKYQLKNNLDP